MPHRWIATVLLVSLVSACATPRVVRLETGQGAPWEIRPPASQEPLAVSAEAFEEALEQWVLSTPLPLRPAQQGWLVRVSYPSDAADAPWQRLISKSFGGICEPGQRTESCLSLLDDVMGLSEWDKLGVAVALSLEPMKESIAKAVEKTLAPQLFYTLIATGLMGWVILAANPEPVFTKAAALVSVLLLVYLGVDAFVELVVASRDLKWATDKATTPKELEQAGQRFGDRVGPVVSRVFVLAVTVAMSQGMAGGAALLASRLPLLPSYSEAAMVGASRVGITLANVGQVSAVAVVGNVVVVSLPATAVAMAAQGLGGGSAAGFRSWGSFSGLKNALGAAGEGKQWHHLVEQTPGNVERFGPQALHNTENVIPLETAIHRDVSGLYSSIRTFITGSRTLTVRQWLSTQSYEAQRAFGLKTIDNVRNGVWR